ncbi:hypothetical protein D1614_15510 [Maribellus luteus]|uniref:AIR9-like A9 domain-containing protein n=1 Tax=Maribellus luteus TaxID=2305463 RepID=A0A399SWV3_9BACT|nr:FISUMP domain-containing protein [Maribellus luteus]RIJ47164.1 hypothetical protein D1614_15510 [Maribellus luteus]
MKKVLLIIVVLLGLQHTYAQVTPIEAVRIANASTPFTSNLSVGTLIYNVATHKVYRATDKIVGTTNITTALAERKLVAFGSAHSLDASNGSSTDALYVDADGDVGVGTTSPDASAIFDVSSTSKGFMVPRVSTKAISNPVRGMVIYSPEIDCLCFYDGSGWVDLCSGSSLNLPPVAGSVTQSGITMVGKIMTGSYAYTDDNGDPEGSSTFQWYRSTGSDGSSATAISGATGINYTLSNNDIGKYIGFAVVPVARSGSSPGREHKASIFSGQVLDNAPLATNVTQSGMATLGNTLTGNYTYYDANGDQEGASTFQWYYATGSDGSSATAISGATGRSYALSNVDLGKFVGFAVTSVARTGTLLGSEVKVLPFSGPVTDNAPVATNVAQSGTAKVGETLTGSYSYFDADGDAQGTTTFKWYRSASSNGSSATVISGATGISYTLSNSDFGKYIGFAVTPVAVEGVSPGIEVKAATFVGLVTDDAPVASNVTQSGIAKVGSTLTGNYTYSDANNDPQGTSVFKWYRSASSSGSSATVISGTTGSSYVLSNSDFGKYIGFAVIPVAITGTSLGSEVKVAAFAGPVTDEAPVASNVTQSGISKVGSTLTGNYTYSDVDGNAEGVSVFKWYRSASSNGSSATIISGATGRNYTLRSSDIGQYIGFSVTPVASAGTLIGNEVKVVTFSGPVTDDAPVASNVTQTGSLSVGSVLTGSYSYSDANGDAQGASTFKWYRATSAAGAGAAAISGATGSTYTLTSADVGKYIGFAVTPVATTGALLGSEVKASAFAGPVIYLYAPDGTLVVEVRSATGRIWMDRNLGANRAATSSTDTEAIGDLYQWGRGPDGHQKITSSSTNTLSNSDTPGHNKFITTTTSPRDWRIPQNENLWQGSNGINNPCPSGYHVPTKAEWEAEINSWSTKNTAGAYASKLKLPLPYWRTNVGGGVSNNRFGTWTYWSADRIYRSDVHGNGNYYFGLQMTMNETSAFVGDGPDNSEGIAVRCIKD